MSAQTQLKQVTDLTLIRENQSHFVEYLANNSNANPGIDLTLTVLTTGFGSTYKSSDINLPAEIGAAHCMVFTDDGKYILSSAVAEGYVAVWRLDRSNNHMTGSHTEKVEDTHICIEERSRTLGLLTRKDDYTNDLVKNVPELKGINIEVTLPPKKVTDLMLIREKQSHFVEYLANNSNANPGIDLTLTVLTTGFGSTYKSSDIKLPAEMVTDLTLIRENQSHFVEYLTNNSNANPGIDLTLTVLTTGFGSTYKSSDINLPAEMIVPAGVTGYHFADDEDELPPLLGSDYIRVFPSISFTYFLLFIFLFLGSLSGCFAQPVEDIVAASYKKKLHSSVPLVLGILGGALAFSISVLGWYLCRDTTPLAPDQVDRRALIGSLPIHVYSPDQVVLHQTGCSICLSEYEQGGELRSLPLCTHIFHIECLDMAWGEVTRPLWCPVCRRDYTTYRPSASV